MVSKEKQKMLVSKFHKSPLVSHRGMSETFKKLKEKYWWPRIYKDVVEFGNIHVLPNHHVLPSFVLFERSYLCLFAS